MTKTVFWNKTTVNWFKSNAGSQLGTKNPKNPQNFGNGNDSGTKSRKTRFLFYKKCKQKFKK